MKISRKWLENYITSNKSDEVLEHEFTQLGLECSIIKTNSIDSNVVVGRVISCEKHPNADRLKVCKVDINEASCLDIVCGAPNVTHDILVPVAKVGTKINDFEIKETKIRNIQSKGMLCSEKELGLSENHDGIMILNSKLKIGESINDALDLQNDTIFDFDMTPNRGDCFSHLGVARELAIIEDKKIKDDSFDFKKSNFKSKDMIDVEVADFELCSRYACRVIKNIKVAESPKWLKDKMKLLGQKSINNIVDLANYVMFDTGQPLHAFDYSKLEGNKIEVRLAKKSEKILCLNKEVNKLDGDDIVIADKNGPVAIAGVIGGYDSQVNSDTNHILIESAVFNEINIRKTSKKYDYVKEASKRFERGVDYSNVINVMDKFTMLIVELAGGEVSSDYVDVNNDTYSKKQIKFNFENCNIFLGLSLKIEEYKEIFSKLNIHVSTEQKYLFCEIPSYRNDLNRSVDLYEEVARVYGYDNIPISKTFTNSYKAIFDNSKDINNQIRLILSSRGFFEHYSNSLYSENVLKDFNNNETPEIINESSLDMKFMRNSLMPGMLKAVSFNEKRGQDSFKLFEIGRVHSLIKSYNKEEETLGMVWFGKSVDHWISKFEADIFYSKGEILSFLNQLKLKNLNFEIKKSDFSKVNLNITSNKKTIGYIRILDSNLHKKYKIKNSLIFSEISIDKLHKHIDLDIGFKQISQYPIVNRDISILVSNEIESSKIIKSIFSCSDILLKNAKIFDVYFGKELDKNTKSLSISLKFQSDKKTLVDKEVDKRVNKILKNLKSNFNAIQR